MSRLGLPYTPPGMGLGFRDFSRPPPPDDRPFRTTAGETPEQATARLTRQPIPPWARPGSPEADPANWARRQPPFAPAPAAAAQSAAPPFEEFEFTPEGEQPSAPPPFIQDIYNGGDRTRTRYVDGKSTGSEYTRGPAYGLGYGQDPKNKFHDLDQMLARLTGGQGMAWQQGAGHSGDGMWVNTPSPFQQAAPGLINQFQTSQLMSPAKTAEEERLARMLTGDIGLRQQAENRLDKMAEYTRGNLPGVTSILREGIEQNWGPEKQERAVKDYLKAVQAAQKAERTSYVSPQTDTGKVPPVLPPEIPDEIANAMDGQGQSAETVMEALYGLGPEYLTQNKPALERALRRKSFLEPIMSIARPSWLRRGFGATAPMGESPEAAQRSALFRKLFPEPPKSSGDWW